ncbi:MAG: hypothetical protein L6V85_01935 [Clostridiales bacterium]|nr:MAG: hypothetical protein L6V85_01935 [Clostridiales bacterium]
MKKRGKNSFSWTRRTARISRFQNVLKKRLFRDFSDISVTSFHKTLPVYSGGAALFCNNDTLTDDLLRLRADLHTTSPCYLTLASIDYSLDERRISGEEKYEKLFEKVNLLKEKLPGKIIKNDDFTRLVVRCGDNGFSALRQKNVVPEMTFYDLAVFILSPEKRRTNRRYLRRLKRRELRKRA